MNEERFTKYITIGAYHKNDFSNRLRSKNVQKKFAYNHFEIIAKPYTLLDDTSFERLQNLKKVSLTGRAFVVSFLFPLILYQGVHSINSNNKKERDLQNFSTNMTRKRSQFATQGRSIYPPSSRLRGAAVSDWSKNRSSHKFTVFS